MATVRCARAALAMSIAVAIVAGTAHAEERRVVDELLDILRQNNQITDQQYRQLKQRAEEERRRDAQPAVAAPPAATPTTAVAAAPSLTPTGTRALQAYWAIDGFHIGAADDSLRLQIRGRVHNDWAVTTASRGLRERFDIPATETGTDIRRARIDLQVVLWDVVTGRIDYDLSTGEPEAKDVWVGLRRVPVLQTLRVGHFKEPFSLEEMMSSNDITFMERGLPNVFAPSRNTGLGAFGDALDSRLSWAAGAFREADDFGDGFGADDDYNLTGRLTGLPWVRDDRHFVHLGFAYSHQFRDAFMLEYAERPEAALYPVSLVNTGEFETNGVDLLAPELAVVYGPFSAQGEYIHSFISRPGAGDADFGGFYVYASCFLTGESRAYEREEGRFDRVRPRRNFGFDGRSWGAWEVAARFSRLDLDSSGIGGGILNDVTAGVNWYLNPNARIMVNYVHGHRQATGDADIAESRFQIAF